MDWVIQIGLVELAIGGLLGWAMVLRQESPELPAPDRRRRPAADPPDPPRLRDDGPDPDRRRARRPRPADGGRGRRSSSAPLVNPFLFVPLAFDPDVENRLWYRSLAVVSFLGVSGGLVAAAIVGRLRHPACADRGRSRHASRPRSARGPRAAAALLALPAAAGATLAYVKAPFNPAVYAAADNGSGATRSGRGRTRASPRTGSRSPTCTKAPAARPGTDAGPGGGRRLADPDSELADSFYLAFSPDSRTIAALRGPEVGKRKLVLIDVASGAEQHRRQRLLQRLQLLARTATNSSTRRRRANSYPPAATSTGSTSRRGRSASARRPADQRPSLARPALGAERKDRLRQAPRRKERKYGPKNELFLMNPSGKGVKRLTHTKVDPLLRASTRPSGRPTAAACSPSSRDRTPATPSPSTPRPAPAGARQGTRGAASSAPRSPRTARLVLGCTGGFEPGPGHNVASIPYGGGKPKVLANNAFEPDWSR